MLSPLRTHPILGTGVPSAQNGQHHFALPDIGGAIRLGGTGVVRDCFFASNSASTRGLAIGVVGSANISGSSFDGNEVYCAAGLYRKETEEVNGSGRRKSVVPTGEHPTAVTLLTHFSMFRRGHFAP